MEPATLWLQDDRSNTRQNILKYTNGLTDIINSGVKKKKKNNLCQQVELRQRWRCRSRSRSWRQETSSSGSKPLDVCGGENVREPPCERCARCVKNKTNKNTRRFSFCTSHIRFSSTGRYRQIVKTWEDWYFDKMTGRAGLSRSCGDMWRRFNVSGTCGNAAAIRCRGGLALTGTKRGHLLFIC